MRGRHDTRGRTRPLPEHRDIDTDELADTAQGVLDSLEFETLLADLSSSRAVSGLRGSTVMAFMSILL